ncbi:MAG: hypothetical protein ABIL69_03795 [candidate division WOR-3 bacterium]
MFEMQNFQVRGRLELIRKNFIPFSTDTYYYSTILELWNNGMVKKC